MKYLLAFLAIIGEILVYGGLSSAIGWSHGGGAFVTLLMIAIIGATWKAITKKSDDSDVDSDETEEQE